MGILLCIVSVKHLFLQCTCQHSCLTVVAVTGTHDNLPIVFKISAFRAQDNYPHMDYTALDLSPYYLYEARSNIKDWHRLRQPKLSMGGVDGSGAHFLQAAAEKIPQPDASHDVVRALSSLYTAFL